MKCLLTLLIVLTSAAEAWGQCGPRGCGLPDTVEPDTVSHEPLRGLATAVVRVIVDPTDNQRSDSERDAGSGVLVVYHARFCVLTAWHVVNRAAKGIAWVRYCNGQWAKASVRHWDATWDLASLAVPLPPAEVQPVELEWGRAANPLIGDALRSCGYGGDDRLAVNLGRVLAYRYPGPLAGATRWTADESFRGEPPDFVAISGRIRNGDSGGPVFNAEGRLVGIAWGGHQGEVCATAGGRLHAFLARAIPTPVASQVSPGPEPWKPATGWSNPVALSRPRQQVEIHAPVIVHPQPPANAATEPTVPVVKPPERPLVVPAEEPPPASSPAWPGMLIVAVAGLLGGVIYFTVFDKG
jgi:S1-C subfamily serine protease